MNRSIFRFILFVLAMSFAAVEGVASVDSHFQLLGHEKGNGGDVVACFKNYLSAREAAAKITNQEGNVFSQPDVIANLESARILDLYEFQLPAGFPPRVRPLINQVGTMDSMIQTLIERAAQKSTFGQELADRYELMPLDNWRATEGVIELDDSLSAVLLPQNCILVQSAVRQGNVVYYDAPLFEVLPPIHQTALIMHELIYRLAVDNGASDSRVARQANGLLLSMSEWDHLSPDEIDEQINSLGDFAFPKNFLGNSIWVSRLTSNPTDRGLIYFAANKQASIHLDGSSYVVSAGSTVGVFASGSIGSFSGLLQDQLGNWLPGFFIFQKSGSLLTARLTGAFHWQGFQWSFANGGLYEFNAERDVLSFVPSAQTKIGMGLGSFDVQSGGRVTFYSKTQQIASLDLATGAYGLPQGFFVSNGHLEFAANGSIKSASKIEGTARFQNASIQIKHGWAVGRWSQGSVLEELVMSEVPPEGMDPVQLWTKFYEIHFDKDSKVKFSADGSIEKINFGFTGGSVKGHTDSQKYSGSYPGKTVFLDSAGDISKIE